jgi:chromosome segregation ATPase
MADIVERLRGFADMFEAQHAPGNLVLHLRAGADEIERKKAEIASLLNALADERTECMRLRADLRLAVMSDGEECKALSQEVERLVKSRNRWGQKYNALLEKHKRLRAALAEAGCDHCRHWFDRAALEENRT